MYISLPLACPHHCFYLLPIGPILPTLSLSQKITQSMFLGLWHYNYVVTSYYYCLVHHHQWRRRQLRHLLLCPLMHRHCRDQMIQKKGLGGGKKARVKKQRFCWSGGCGQKWFYRDEYKKLSLGRIKTLQLGAKFYNLSLTRLRNFTYQEKNSKKCYL